MKQVSLLFDFDTSRGQAVEHLMNTAITFDTNHKLSRRNGIISAIVLLAALATEAYQLPLDPAGYHVCGDGLSEVLQE